MTTFNEELDRPREWCEDLLEELASTLHVAYTCDMRGTFRSGVNQKRREFLEDVLGLTDVDYYACEYCETFALQENAEQWPFPSTCPDCEDELPENLRSDE